MEYEGMSCEVVARGIKGGMASKGSTTGSTTGSATGTGAGAAGVSFLVFFFLGFFLPPIVAAPAPPRQQSKAKTSSHCQICNWEPQEPDAVEPELAEPEESLALDPVLKESPELEEPAGPEPKEFTDESKEAPEPEEADESMAVMVVVWETLYSPMMVAEPNMGKSAAAMAKVRIIVACFLKRLDGQDCGRPRTLR